MIRDVPSPLLRSFVAVVDGGSLAAAARAMNRSESALSLQIQRLEAIIGLPVFDREGRMLKLNPVGSLLLGHARGILARIDAARRALAVTGPAPLRIGIVQDFVGNVLQPTLAELVRLDPHSRFSLVIGSTADLLQAMGEDRIDTALCAGDFAQGFGRRDFAMQWFGKPDLADLDVVPLLGIAPPCPFLQAAQQALDGAGKPWRLAMVTPSLDGLRAATQAGLGLTCRTAAGMGMVPLSDPALPILPGIPYSLIERRASGAGASETARLMAQYLAQAAPEGISGG